MTTKRNNNFLKRASCAALALIMLMGASFAYFSDYASTQVTGTAGTVDIELNSNINLLDPDGKDIINPGDRRDGSFEVVNMGNKSVDVKTEIILSVASNFDHELTLSGDSATQSEYDLYYASDVELVEGEGWKPKAGAKPVAEKVIAEDGKSITYTLPVYALNGNSNEHDEVETVDGVDTFIKTEDIVMLMNGQADNLWQNSTVSIATKVYAKQHENTNAGWDLVSFDAVDNVEEGIGTLSLDAMTTYGTRVSNIGVTVSQVVDNGAAASVEGDAQFDVVEIGKFTTTKTDKLIIENLDAGTYLITATSAPSGYTVESEAVVVITEGKTTNKTLSVSVQSVSDIVYSTIDTDGNKLADVSVIFESNNEYGEFKTNDSGFVMLGGLNNGSQFTVTVPEKVGELPILTDSAVVIQAGQSDTAVYGVLTERVYASKIGNTLYIASYEISEMDGMQATAINDITLGGTIPSANDISKAVFVDEVKPLSTNYWFRSKSQMTEIENIENLNLSKVADTSYMFQGCNKLTSIDLTSLNFGNVVTTNNMFDSCMRLTTIDVSDLDVSNVVNMYGMFRYCEGAKTIDVSSWDMGNVRNASYMFQGCNAMTSAGDLSGWDVGNLVNAQNMFSPCAALGTLGDLNSWDVSNLVNTKYMFFVRISPLPDWYVPAA